MHLVDADRLYDQVEARYRLSRGEEHKAERMLLDVICDSPTIDAIPVEWLRNLCAIAKMETDDKMFIDWLIQTWQKEQEAR